MMSESEPVIPGTPLGAVVCSARLGNDIARCNGSGEIEDGVQYWREGCESCLRRTAPRSGRLSMISPPLIIAFECEYLIEPNSQFNQPKLY